MLIYGGTRDPDDLQAYSLFTGERDEDVHTHSRDRARDSTTVRRVPVLSPAQIAQLPAGKVLIVRRGMPVAVGTVRMAWKRWDVKAAQQAERREMRRALREIRASQRRDRRLAWAMRVQTVGERIATTAGGLLRVVRYQLAELAARLPHPRQRRSMTELSASEATDA
jgi:hypothetical protein